MQSLHVVKRLLLLILALAVVNLSEPASGSVNYSYDPVGRLATASYDNGICIVYAYDQTGNRTSQTNSTASASSAWGTGVFGCFMWTP